jgi:aspartate kinase
MNWLVVKLGGTSQCKKGYDNIITTIKKYGNSHRIVFVLSAESGVTNLLEKFIKSKDMKYIDEVVEKNNKLVEQLEYDTFKLNTYAIKKQNFYEDCLVFKSSNNDIYFESKILGYGEVLTTSILTDYLEYNNLDIELINSYNVIKSKKETFKLYPLCEFYADKDIFHQIYSSSNKNIFIAQGFIASTPNGKTILLGRGGSDTSGALYANMLEAEQYIVYTDVDGIYTTDPRICDKAQIIKSIDYNIVQELSAMGAKVMHPSSILPCANKNIPIIIKNTFNDDTNTFTVITNVPNQINKISAIALQKDVKLIKITSESMWNNYGFVYDIFRRFSERRIDVNIVSTSQFTISTTCEEKDMILIKDLIQDLEEKYTVELINNCSIVSIVTNYIPEIYSKINFTNVKHHLLSIGATNNSISFVIDTENSNEIVNTLHSSLL